MGVVDKHLDEVLEANDDSDSEDEEVKSIGLVVGGEVVQVGTVVEKHVVTCPAETPSTVSLVSGREHHVSLVANVSQLEVGKLIRESTWRWHKFWRDHFDTTTGPIAKLFREKFFLGCGNNEDAFLQSFHMNRKRMATKLKEKRNNVIGELKKEIKKRKYDVGGCCFGKCVSNSC